MTPEYLMWEVGGAGLELGVARLVGPLQHRHQLKLLLGQLRGGQIIERRLIVNLMDNF